MANKRLNAIITIGGTVTGGLKNALGSTQSKLQGLGRTIRNLEREQRDLGRSMRDAMQNGRAVGQAHERYRALTEQIAQARREQDRFNRSQRSMESARNIRSGAAGRIGATVGTGVTVGIPILAAGKAAMDYDYQLQMIGNTADMTQAQIDKLSEKIMQTSKDVNQSAPNMQKAFGFLIAAGMEVDTASRMLVNVGKTATAAGAEVEDMAKATFTLNDSLKITSETAMARAMDALAKAGKMGNFELKAMSQNLPVLGSSFSALKMEGLEAVTTLGAALQIARKGAGDEAEAANNLKNYMAKLQSPETLKKAQKFGLDLNRVIVDAQKKGENPFEAATNALFKVIGNDQKKLGEIFADMQVQNFLRPMFQNMQEYQKIKAAALNSAGTVDRDFLKMMGTTKEQVDAVGSAVGRMGIAFGGAVSAAFGPGDIAKKIDSVTAWITANEELVGTIVKVGGGMLALSLGVNSVVYAFGAAKTVWTVGKVALTFLSKQGWLLTGALNLLAKVAPFAATALGMVAKAALFIGRALLMNPIGLAVTVIAGGALLIWQNWETLGPKFQALWTWITDAAKATWTWLKDVFFAFHPLGLVIANWEPIKTYFTGLWDDITATARKALDWIVGKIGAVGDAWRSTKSFFGFGDDAKPAPAGRPAPRIPPPVPPPAGGRGGGAGGSVTNNNTWHITQQPGESADAVANRVIKKIDARDKFKRGSTLYDRPAGQ